MANFWNVRRGIDRISRDILDLIDNLRRNLRCTHFVSQELESEVMTEMNSVDLLENLQKCQKTIDIMTDMTKLLKLEGRRRELEQNVRTVHNFFTI